MAVQRIGIALGPEQAEVVAPGVEGVLTVASNLPTPAEDPTGALLQMFSRLQAMLGEIPELAEDAAAGRIRVRVALLPPLSDVRLISLPPLRADEMQAVLRRDASRHFLGSGRPLIVAGERFGERGSEHLAPVLAAAAPRALVEGLQRAVESVGWELERIVPAHAAWLHAPEKAAHAAEGSATEAVSSGVRVVIALESGTAHILRTIEGVPYQIRRVPADPSSVVGAVGSVAGRALILASDPERAEIADALTAAGWGLARAADPSARVAAALHAGDAGPELVPTPMAVARKEHSRRATVRMVAAALVVLALAASVHLLGRVRQYNAVRRERAELRDVVAPAVAARDSLDAINARLEELRALGSESARWTFSLVEMSVLLPAETHLISLRASGDTAVVEAEGGIAGEALAALRTATTLEDVRVEGNIQREIEDGTASSERFTLSAVLAPRSKTPAPARDASPPRDSQPQNDAQPPRQGGDS